MYELDVIESEFDRECDEHGSLSLFSADEALGFYRSLSESPGARSLDFVDCGHALLEFGMNEEAYECYGIAIAKDGGCVLAYLQRGELSFQAAIGGRSDDEVSRHGMAAVSDFQTGMFLSFGSTNVAWKLANAQLILGEFSAAWSSIDDVLLKRSDISEECYRDFLYLSGFAKLFMGEQEGAIEAFNEMLLLNGGGGEGLFGLLAVLLWAGDLEAAGEAVRSLRVQDCVLGVAGDHLLASGCSSFLDVARALVGVGNGSVEAGRGAVYAGS